MSESSNHSNVLSSTEISSTLLKVQSRPGQPPKPPFSNFKTPTEDVWQPLGTHITIGGRVISGGLFYYGRSLKARNSELNDPCLIDPTLPIAPGLPSSDEATNAPASWFEMSPVCRGSYLAWLSANRNDPNVCDSHLLLYLYGLERRLLIDGPREHFPIFERMTIIREIRRMISIYKMRQSFAEQARHVLAVAWALETDPACEFDLSDDFDLRSNECACIFPHYLSSFVAQNISIPGPVMLEWYRRHPNCIHIANATNNRIFAEIFCSKLQSIPFSPSNTSQNLCIHYDAVNPALGILDFEFPGIPDVFNDPRGIQLLNQTAKECQNTLSDYLEHLKQPETNAVGALLKLPLEIRKANTSLKRFANFLVASVKDGVGSVRVKDIFRALELPIPSSIDNALADDIGKLIEYSCFQYAPNRHLHGTSFTLDDRIFLTSAIQSPKPSQPVATLALILRLGALIAQCDEDISQSEIQVLQEMILKRKFLDDTQRASLLLWVHWCLNTPQHIEDIQPILAQIAPNLRDQISKILINVALADGKIDPRERENLVILHRAIGLPSTWVDLSISSQNGIQIPKCDDIQPTKPVSEIEVKRVHSSANLSPIDVSLDLNQALSNICETAPQQDIQKIFSTHSEIQQKPRLDSTHQAFLADICKAKSWPRLRFFEIAISHHLMADRAMQAINQAAILSCGAEIITDGDIVSIDIEQARHLSLS